MKYQHGFNLIELMITLVISLLLLFGLSTVFLNMRQAFFLRQNMANTQNNERLAVQFLSTAVRNAGATPNPLTLIPPIQPIKGTGANTWADTLTVKFWSDPSVADQGCSAQLIPNHAYTNVFSVTGGYLSCTETDATASPPTTTTVNLIGGTSNSKLQLTGMNILYGIDPTGSGSVGQYASAANITDWNTVKTVTFTLLFNAPLAGKEKQTVTSLSLTQTVPFMIGL
jgi:type IV pilus assembly protein PilW